MCRYADALINHTLSRMLQRQCLLDGNFRIRLGIELWTFCHLMTEITSTVLIMSQRKLSGSSLCIVAVLLLQLLFAQSRRHRMAASIACNNRPHHNPATSSHCENIGKAAFITSNAETLIGPTYIQCIVIVAYGKDEQSSTPTVNSTFDSTRPCIIVAFSAIHAVRKQI